MLPATPEAIASPNCGLWVKKVMKSFFWSGDNVLVLIPVKRSTANSAISLRAPRICSFFVRLTSSKNLLKIATVSVSPSKSGIFCNFSADNEIPVALLVAALRIFEPARPFSEKKLYNASLGA